MLAGAGLLWLGWAGFNGGDPYAANVDSSIAVINTNVCAAMSLLVWTVLDVIFFGKPSVIGAVQGMITGLVCITPAAGNSLTQKKKKKKTCTSLLCLIDDQSLCWLGLGFRV
jgi:ammonia channel protein AmtB